MAIPEVISGNLSGVLEISGGLAGIFELTGGLSLPNGIVPEYYDGEYTVTPTKSDQYLYTEGKLMRDDVTVLKIPFFRTGNLSGGDTIYIGG